MRIFIDVTSSCKSAKNTGMQRMTRKLFAELGSRAEVVPLCWNTLGKFFHYLGEPELRNLRDPFRNYRGPVSRPEWRGEKFPGEVRRLFARQRCDLRTELRDGDVLFMPDIYPDERTTILPRLMRQSSARSLAIFHDAAALKLPLATGTGEKRFRSYIESLAAFDVVLCISHEAQDDLHDFWRRYGTRPRARTFVEGWPLEFPEAERSGAARATGRPVVLCVGSFDARKNHLALFDAAERLWNGGDDFELQLVGRSTGAWGHKVIRRLDWLRLKSRPVSWLRHVDDATLHRAYRECAFTVYPTLMEGFGLPIIESLWHGKPCVCGSNGALGEVAAGGGCRFVDQADVASLAAGIHELLADKQTYARLVAEARSRTFRTWGDYTDTLVAHLRGAPANAGLVAAR